MSPKGDETHGDSGQQNFTFRLGRDPWPEEVLPRLSLAVAIAVVQEQLILAGRLAPEQLRDYDWEAASTGIAEVTVYRSLKLRYRLLSDDWPPKDGAAQP